MVRCFKAFIRFLREISRRCLKQRRAAGYIGRMEVECDGSLGQSKEIRLKQARQVKSSGMVALVSKHQRPGNRTGGAPSGSAGGREPEFLAA